MQSESESADESGTSSMIGSYVSSLLRELGRKEGRSPFVLLAALARAGLEPGFVSEEDIVKDCGEWNEGRRKSKHVVNGFV